MPENPNYLGGFLGGTEFIGAADGRTTQVSSPVRRSCGQVPWNPAAFAAPAAGTYGDFGNEGFHPLPGPYRFIR